ncbi:general substrate transporter [Cadophora sp. DSE1049]|nr:general substrate transporter [Cadophora sp. DSE1049]
MGLSDSNVNPELTSILVTDPTPWYKRGYLIRLNFVIVSLVMFSSANGYDGSLMNGLQALHQWNDEFNTPSGAWLGFINAIYWVTSALFFPAASWISNRYGRKMGVWIGYIFLIVSTVLQTASHNSAMFVVARVVLGGASAFWSMCVPLLIAETAFPSHRGQVTALYNCGWYVGSLASSWIVFGTRDMASSWAWRIPSVCQVLVPLIALPGFTMSAQSPRWLVSKGRVDEAHQVLANIHAGGDYNHPLVTFELAEIGEAIRVETELNATLSYSDMLKTPGNRRRLLITVSLGVFSQFVGNGVVSYYLALVLSTVGIKSVRDQTLISACLQLWNLFWAAGAALLVDKLGRRALFLSSALVMLVSYIVVTALSASFANSGVSGVGLAVIPMLFIYFAGYDIALTPLFAAYPVEIWPFQLRSRGVTVAWMTAYAVNTFNIFVNPIALDAIGWKYYLVFVFFLVAMVVTVYFFYPETKGYSLEEMTVVFDKKESDIHGLEAGYSDEKADGAKAVAENEIRETKSTGSL